MKNLSNKLTLVLVLLLVLTTLTACGRAKDRDIEKDSQTDIEEVEGEDPLSDEVNELGDDLEGVDDLEDLEDPNIDPEDLDV